MTGEWAERMIDKGHLLIDNMRLNRLQARRELLQELIAEIESGKDADLFSCTDIERVASEFGNELVEWLREKLEQEAE